MVRMIMLLCTLFITVGVQAQFFYKKNNLKPIEEIINKAYDRELVITKYKDGSTPRPVNERRTDLDKRYLEVKEAVKTLADTHDKEYYGKVNEYAYLLFRLKLTDKSTEEYQRLLSQVNPNDTVALVVLLPQYFIEAKMNGKYANYSKQDMAEFGAEYIRLMSQYITNPKVKHQLLKECSWKVFAFGKHFANIDKFWIPFCKYAVDDQEFVKRYQYKVDAIKRNKVGTKATEITMYDPEGKECKLLERFKGKTIYVDFWATWCAPCCKEIPFLEKRVEELKDKKDKLEFVSISIDLRKDLWLKKLAKDKPDWPQFIVTKEEYNRLRTFYGITGIPRFIIINPDGTIADADAFRPSNQQFAEKMSELLR